MLCLDKSVYETLTVLKKYCKERYGNEPTYTTLSKIILVKDVKLKTAAANLDASDTTKLVEGVKDGVKGFLAKEHGWQRPPKLSPTVPSVRSS